MSPRVRAMLQSLPRRGRWLFPSHKSLANPYSDRTLLTRLKRMLKALGLKGHVHTFRHAFISKALVKGITESIVREWVGHVDAEILRHYTHIASASSQAAMQRLTEGRIHLQPEGCRAGAENDKETSAQNQHSEPIADSA